MFKFLALVLMWLVTACGGEKAETPPEEPSVAENSSSADAADMNLSNDPGPSAVEPKAPEAKSSASAGTSEFPAPAEAGFADENLMHVKLKEVNPGYNLKGQFAIQNNKVLGARLGGTGVQDLSPLRGLNIMELDLQSCPVTDLHDIKGMPLRALFLDLTQVYDLRPIAGMPLESLYLNNTGVKNISMLKGMPLKEFNAANSAVDDISALEGAPIESLWLSRTSVSDISALAKVPLVSLTLHGTKVEDLSPLAGHPTLQRLHIGETPVTDLRPLEGLKLTRLIFPVGQIKEGLDLVKAMPLQEIGTAFDDTDDDRTSPAAFWKQHGE